MTALAEAFTKAGFATAREKLDAITREAIAKSPANWDAIIDRLYAITRNDPALLFEIMGDYRRRIFDEQAKRIMEKMRAEASMARATVGGDGNGQRRNDAQAHPAQPVAAARDDGGVSDDRLRILKQHEDPAVIPKPERAGEGADQNENDSQPACVRPSPKIADLRAAAAAKAAMTRSKAYIEIAAIHVNGRSLLDATTTEALEWSERRTGEIRIIEALCSLIPDPRKPIRDQITNEIAEQAGRLVNGRNSR